MESDINSNTSSDIEYTEKAYTTSEVATMLDIAVPTVRKYAQTLERAGYVFLKTKKTGKQQARLFVEKDIISLRYLIQIREKSNIRVNEAVDVVINKFGKGAIQGIMPSDTAEIEPYNKQYDELKGLMQQQSEVIKELSDKMDKQQEQIQQQQEYIDNRMQERDNALMQSMNELLETRKQIASSEYEKKKGFWNKLFRK